MKQQYEEKIDNFLEQLSREFPRLEILDDVYPSTEIQSLVANIYLEGVKFARECTRYYSRSSAGASMHSYPSIVANGFRRKTGTYCEISVAPC